MQKFLFLIALVLPGLVSAGPGWQEVAATHPQAQAVIDQYTQSFNVDADGKYSSETHFRATILQEQAIQALARYNDSYNVDYDTVTVKRAVVITPEGEEITVGNDNIKDIPMPAFGPFYLQNVRLVIISFPQLEVGSTVDVTMTARRNSPPMNGQFNLVTQLQGAYPILDQRFTVTLPSSVKLRWKAFRGEVEFTTTENGENITYSWTKNNVPQVIPEPSMPPYPEVVPTLVASTIPDWKTVSRWYADLSLEGQKITPEIEELIADIIEGKKTQEEKIRALFYWSAQNIRYVETTMSGEKAGFKPEPAAVTFKNRYGVCRDKAEFLTAMLRHIGVDASITLITAGVKTDPLIPTLNFNHAIVAITNPDGSYRFLDPTAEDSRQYLPYSDQDKYALVCRKEGEGIQLTKLAPPEQNRERINLETTVKTDGTLMTHVSIHPAGIYDLIFRSFLNRLPPSRREMIFKTIVGETIPNGVLSDFSLSDLDDLNTPVSLEFTVTGADQVIDTGKYLVFTAPSQGNSFDFLRSAILGGASLEHRNYPLSLPSTMESVIEEVVVLPAGYEVWSMPDNDRFDQDRVVFTSTFSSGNGELKHVQDLSLQDHVYSGAGYDSLREALARSESSKNGKIILVKKGEAQ